MRNAQGQSFAAPNFIMASDVVRIIPDQIWKGNTGMLAYLSYLFPLRAPSETLRPTIAIPNEKLLKFAPHGPKSLIWHRAYYNNSALVIKFRCRENIRGGRISIRHCLCAMASSPDRAFCPVHGFWVTNRGA